jgi:hypothetical protein
MFHRQNQAVFVLTLLMLRGVASHNLYLHCNPVAKWQEGTCYFSSLPTFKAFTTGVTPEGFISELAVHPEGVNELHVFDFNPRDMMAKVQKTMKEAFIYERLDLNKLAKDPQGFSRDFSDDCFAFAPDNSVEPPKKYQKYGIMDTELYPFIATFQKGLVTHGTPFPNILVCNIDLDTIHSKAKILEFCPDNPVQAYTFPVDPTDLKRGYLTVPYVQDCYDNRKKTAFQSKGYAGLRLITQVDESDFTEPGKFLIVHSEASEVLKQNEKWALDHDTKYPAPESIGAFHSFTHKTIENKAHVVFLFAPPAKPMISENKEYKVIVTPPKEVTKGKKLLL